MSSPTISVDPIYRSLQRHLDRQAIGFPAVRSGAELKLLRLLFTPEEAKVALLLSCRPTPQDAVIARATGDFSADRTVALLESAFQKGAIGWKLGDGVPHWFVMPMVVGIYEGQDGNPSKEFLAVAGPYMRTRGYARSFLAVNPPQMRTIPINKSVTVKHAVATYDQVRPLVKNAKGPFVAFNCTCREIQRMKGAACKKTERLETCLGMGAMASMLLRRRHGREISAAEALRLLEQNEADGLVLQPANERNAEFICSCCGCCCGMLGMQKKLPHPVDFWASNYFARADSACCTKCGGCVKRCQVDAVALDGPGGTAKINPSRCIGCGLCVTACPKKAIDLNKKEIKTVPPENRENLLDAIAANKKGRLAQTAMLLKVALRMRQ